MNRIKIKRRSTKRGVYCSPTEGTSIDSSRHIIASLLDVAPNYRWKCSSNEDHHKHSPVFAVHDLNVSMLATKESELRKNCILTETWCSRSGGGAIKRVHFEDEIEEQRKVLLQSVVEERADSLPMSRHAYHTHIDYHDIDSNGSLSPEDSMQIKTAPKSILCEPKIKAKVKVKANGTKNLITSPHILVNKQRANHKIMPLFRESTLDDLASNQANYLAKKRREEHSDVNKLISNMVGSCGFAVPLRRLGENVGRGRTVESIYFRMMHDSKRVGDRNNLLDRRFSSFGVGIATDSEGDIYICQIFKG